MKVEEMIHLVTIALKDLKDGEIRIIVRNGEVKHVNALKEVTR